MDMKDVAEIELNKFTMSHEVTEVRYEGDTLIIEGAKKRSLANEILELIHEYENK